ncbi:DUF4303 domain-containing protein [Eikenella longinqua]|uniref:DUF4303 domain-containing protein n=1 Tax=Eikenella longinqua TaxID=1795827 RepID=UPI000ABA4CB1|nr:DUF4303 domain-containing protein [Eikenella longinqua]
MPQPDWQHIENTAYQIIMDTVHSIRRQHPRETVYAAIFHNFYCDNANLYFPSLSVGTEELLARVAEQYRQEYGYAESRAELEQSLRWSGADLAEYMFDGGAAGHAAAQSVQAACAKKPIGTVYTAASADASPAPAAAPRMICCGKTSCRPILLPSSAMKTKA